MTKNIRINITKLVLSGLWAAIVTVATILITIPTPTKGYVNLGDCFVNLGGWLLGGPWGVAAAAIGSALADLILGYGIYAPATFVIKALMALASFGVFKALSGKKLTPFLAAFVGEVIMVAGYFFFEAALYGSFGAAVPGIVPNMFQGAAAIVGAGALYTLIGSRLKGISRLKQ